MNRARRALTPEVAALLTLDADPWLSCDDCFAQVDGVVDGFVCRGAPVPDEFRAHLTGCPACYEEASLLVTLVAEDDGLEPALAQAAFGDAIEGSAAPGVTRAARGCRPANPGS